MYISLLLYIYVTLSHRNYVRRVYQGGDHSKKVLYFELSIVFWAIKEGQGETHRPLYFSNVQNGAIFILRLKLPSMFLTNLHV